MLTTSIAYTPYLVLTKGSLHRAMDGKIKILVARTNYSLFVYTCKMQGLECITFEVLRTNRFLFYIRCIVCHGLGYECLTQDIFVMKAG